MQIHVKLTSRQPPKPANLDHFAFQSMPWLDLELVDECLFFVLLQTFYFFDTKLKKSLIVIQALSTTEIK